MMNDNVKIQALMVYVDHWGKDEMKAQRDIKGFIKMMDKIKDIFYDEDDEEFQQDFDFLREVRMMDTWLHYGPSAAIEFMNRIANNLLSSLGGCDPLYKIPDSYTLKISRKLGVSVLDLYRIGLTEEDMMSVDAIVAW